MIAVTEALIAVAAPVWLFVLYRSARRARAARRAGLDGFVEQGVRVADDERERKVAALRRELGDWRPGHVWLDEVVDARAAGRYD